MYVYMDPEADYGRGEIKYTHVDPFRVYVDPASRDRFFHDASGIILSTYLTKQQVVDLYPDLEEIIDDIDVSENFKSIRYDLYHLEKSILTNK